MSEVLVTVEPIEQPVTVNIDESVTDVVVNVSQDTVEVTVNIGPNATILLNGEEFLTVQSGVTADILLVNQNDESVTPISAVSSTIKIYDGNPQSLELEFDSIENVPDGITDPTDVSQWNTFFHLPTNGVPFVQVKVTGNFVYLYGGSGITLWGTAGPDTGIFFNNTHLVSIIDNAGCVVALAPRSLETNNSVLTTVVLNSCVNAGFYSCDSNYAMNICTMNALTGAEEGAFSGNSMVEEFLLPSLQTAGEFCFSGNYEYTKRFILQSLETIGASCFQASEVVEEIDIRSCLTMGASVTDDTVFQGISGQDITLTVPAALMTCNSGQPHASIQYLIDNNTVTVILSDAATLNLNGNDFTTVPNSEATDILLVDQNDAPIVPVSLTNQTIKVNQPKDISLRFLFVNSGDDTTGDLTITSFEAGTYTTITDDGSSGTITVSINGGAYAAFSSPLVLEDGDTIQFKRTTTGAIGYVQIGGVYE